MSFSSMIWVPPAIASSILRRKMLEAMAGGTQIIEENDIGNFQFLNEVRGLYDPGKIRRSDAAVDDGPGNAKTGGNDALGPQVIGGLARKLPDDQFELREFLAGKALLEDGRERTAFFRKKRQIALRAANVSRENH